MSTDKNEPVDGFSDDDSNSNSQQPGSPDPGRPAEAPKPLSPEEYERAKQEARKEE
jgi:hypothetical protein